MNYSLSMSSFRLMNRITDCIISINEPVSVRLLGGQEVPLRELQQAGLLIDVDSYPSNEYEPHYKSTLVSFTIPDTFLEYFKSSEYFEDKERARLLEKL